MKLYNIYCICKQNIAFFSKHRIRDCGNGVYSVDNWAETQEIIHIIRQIPILNKYAESYIESIPASVRYKEKPIIDIDIVKSLNDKRYAIYNKMQGIIELYESLNIRSEGNGIDIKLPPCEDLKDYISYLKNIDFIFTQCPFLQCDNEILKFGSVDVGSNWLRLVIAATATCTILNNTAALIDKALILRSHYITVQQQEEMYRSMEMKNDVAEISLEVFNSLREVCMRNVISELENDICELKDAEERDKAERTLEKLIILLEKGTEIYATLDSPKEVQALFPEIQGSLELSNSIMKYLEDKEE